jgi:hypothetical protein
MYKPLSLFNILLRALLELAIVCGFAYWAYQLGNSTASKMALAIFIPVIVFAIWGFIDFRQLGRLAESLRLMQELLISGLAALAIYSTGQHALGWLLAVLSVIHHLLVYAIGERLLKR